MQNTTATINKSGIITVTAPQSIAKLQIIEGVNVADLKAGKKETLEDILFELNAKQIPLPLIITGHGLGKDSVTIGDAPAAAAGNAPAPAAAAAAAAAAGNAPAPAAAAAAAGNAPAPAAALYGKPDGYKWRLRDQEVKGDYAGMGENGGVCNRDASQWTSGTIGKSPLVTTSAKLAQAMRLATEIGIEEARFASGAARVRLSEDQLQENAFAAAEAAGLSGKELSKFCMDYVRKSENQFSASDSGTFYLSDSAEKPVQVGLTTVDNIFKAAFRAALRELGIVTVKED